MGMARGARVGDELAEGQSIVRFAPCAGPGKGFDMRVPGLAPFMPATAGCVAGAARARGDWPYLLCPSACRRVLDE